MVCSCSKMHVAPTVKKSSHPRFSNYVTPWTWVCMSSKGIDITPETDEFRFHMDFQISLDWTWKLRHLWCNGYHCGKWTQRSKFKTWTRLFAFHIALIHLGKVLIQLFSFQLWVNEGGRLGSLILLWQPLKVVLDYSRQVYLHIHIHTSMHKSNNIYVYICIYDIWFVHIYIYIYIYMLFDLCIYIYIYICIYICVCVCVCEWVRIYIYIYIYTTIYINSSSCIYSLWYIQMILYIYINIYIYKY